MLQYVIKRVVLAVPTLLLASAVAFLILHLIPGDPAQILAGGDATPAQVAAIRADLGLDQPLVVQYAIWASRALHGDFGNSLIGKYPVWNQIERAYPATLELTLAAFALALLGAIPAGILAALHPRSWLDRAISAANAFVLGVPNFVLGILLILLFALNLDLLPVGGRVAVTEDPVAGLQTLILPAVTLAVGLGAVLTRFVRSALLEVLSEDYVRTARAKGLREKVVIGRHALQNALIPLVTVMGIQVGRLLGGAVIVESVFSWPGMGRLAVQAILTRDYTMIQAVLLLLVTAFIIINLLVDLAYGLLDPRIRASAG